MEWQPIETAPQEEHLSFLVCRKGEMYDYIVIQVSVFQQDLYPDNFEGNVDWDDRITDATHWMPLPKPPEN